MADRTMKAGDNWPPLKGEARDENGLVDLTIADSMEVTIRSMGHLITGVPTVIDPPEVDGTNHWNWKYDWQAGDTDNAGDYDVELKVTWPTAKLQTFPNTGARKLTIEAL